MDFINFNKNEYYYLTDQKCRIKDYKIKVSYKYYYMRINISNNLIYITLKDATTKKENYIKLYNIKYISKKLLLNFYELAEYYKKAEAAASKCGYNLKMIY